MDCCLALNEQIAQLQEVVAEHSERHPAAAIYLSQPGLGVVLAARTLGEFGDDKKRFHDARARKNYSGQSPITRASGKKTIVLARYATNRRLGSALHQQAFSAIGASPGARRLLRRAQGKENRSPRGPAAAREPARRHPARLPQNRHQIRRNHRLAAENQHRRLTRISMGCLPGSGTSAAPASRSVRAMPPQWGPPT